MSNQLWPVFEFSCLSRKFRIQACVLAYLGDFPVPRKSPSLLGNTETPVASLTAEGDHLHNNRLNAAMYCEKLLQKDKKEVFLFSGSNVNVWSVSSYLS